MASGFTTLTNEHLIRTQLWERQLKGLLIDELNGTKFVRNLTNFQDGTTLNIPILGEAEQSDFVEGQAVKYNKFDTGNFTFTIDQYKYSANSISAKFQRDSWYSSDVLASFSPRQHRVIMEGLETRIFNRSNAGQTAGNANQINGADHRWVGGGLNESISIQDFSKANFALRKANVPLNNLVAVIDPSAAYTLETQTNAVNLLSPNPMWQQMINTGAQTGFSFKYNILGFDVYVSNYLPSGLAETINGRTTTVGVANHFFSAAPGGDILPWVMAWRQMPTVYTEFKKDLQQFEYLTITEYGVKLYRPENMVIVLTDTDVVV